MKFLFIWVILTLAVSPMVWALCKVASEADRQAEEAFRRWQIERLKVSDE